VSKQWLSFWNLRTFRKILAPAALCPNTGDYPKLSDEIKNNPAIFLSPEIRAKSEVITDLGAENAKYTKVWDQIKAAE
jgi:hypothetical protein